jgi:hypothetical protein
LVSAQARLAGHLARNGQEAAAEAMFREIVHSQPDAANLPPSFAQVLRPYIDILLKKGADPAANAEIFAATQLMVRPGLAQTQAVLARELSGGTDEASRLFRQSVTLTRQVERARIDLARVEDIAAPTPTEAARARLLEASLSQLQQQQLATHSALASYPRYRAVSEGVISLADLQKALRPGEAYYRMTIVGDRAYGMLITSTGAKAASLNTTGKQLDEQVTALRDTISTVENGQRVTYAFDVGLSHQLFTELLGPFAADLPNVRHLIFEPDGGMLRLPANVLVTDQASVDAYKQRAAAGGDAEFDFRGISWLGRDRDISTAVSPRSLRRCALLHPRSRPRTISASARTRLLRLPLRGWSRRLPTATACFRCRLGRNRFRRMNCRSPQGSCRASIRRASRSSLATPSPTQRWSSVRILATIASSTLRPTVW